MIYTYPMMLMESEHQVVINESEPYSVLPFLDVGGNLIAGTLLVCVLLALGYLSFSRERRDHASRFDVGNVLSRLKLGKKPPSG